MEQINQLQSDNARLRQGNVASAVAVEQGEQSQRVLTPQEPNVQEPGSSGLRYVYVPRERKYPRFSGSSESPSVEEWIEEVRRCLQVRQMSIGEQAYFVYDILDGEAKLEIKLQPASDLRREAFRWADDGEGPRPVRARAFSCDASPRAVGPWQAEAQAVVAQPSNELTELKDCLRRQQAQLDAILKHLSPGSGSLNPPNRQTNYQRRFRFDVDGRPICLRCEQVGHMARDCPVGSRQAQRVGVGPRPPVGNGGNDFSGRQKGN
ncbi:hypothetical protein F2P79_025275 [Pimephales promelas]|nr:hypothetical protein F2P79_025275 [Pimephales promelas]